MSSVPETSHVPPTTALGVGTPPHQSPQGASGLHGVTLGSPSGLGRDSGAPLWGTLGLQWTRKLSETQEQQPGKLRLACWESVTAEVIPSGH